MTPIYLTKNQADFIQDMSLETYEDKLRAFSRIYGELQIKDSHLALDTEEEYRNIVEAILTGEWLIDTGLVFVNIGEKLGMSLFLKETLGTDANNQVIETYKTCDIDEATLFSEEALEKLFQRHPEYNSETFILKEYEAMEKWGKSDSVTVEVSSSAEKEEIPENTKEAIRIVHGTLSKPK